jgi:hypothetical protein
MKTKLSRSWLPFLGWFRPKTSKPEVPMTAKPKIAVIIGSTRPTRFADKPAQWILKQAQAR